MNDTMRTSKRMSLIISAVVLVSGAASSVFGQSNYVLKTGDTMTGTLSVEAQAYPTPTIELFGTNTNYKFIHFTTSPSGASWDIAMDTSADGNKMSFYYSPDGVNNWSAPFYITTNGVLYGDAGGLTDLNVATAIPNGSITANKLDTDYVSSESLTNGTINSLVVGEDLWNYYKIEADAGSVAIGLAVSAENHSFASGCRTVATGLYSHAEGYLTTASGESSHTEGYSTQASGKYSHTEGYSTKASGYSSHAEGANASATNYAAHAEGWDSIAGGQYSHAEGGHNKALGRGSHAEGIFTQATGDFTHAAGFKAKAIHNDTFVWSSSNSDTHTLEFSSTTNSQFNVYAANGIRLLSQPDAPVEIQGMLQATVAPMGDLSMGCYTNRP